MNTPNNIQKFNKLTAKTLGLLYESFPVRRALLFHSEYGLLEYEKAYDENLDNIFDKEERQFVTATLEWLEESGYINLFNIDEHGAHGAVLTAKGLEVLNLVPESIQGKKNESTIGSILREGLKSGATKAFERSATEAVGWLLRKGLEFVPIVIHSLPAG